MKRRLLALMLMASTITTPALAQELNQAIGQDLPDLIALYRDLHQNPELSMQETRSAGLLAEEARRLGFEVTTGVGKTGVVAVLRNGNGPVVMLRADMDALPVEEQTGLPFASRARATSLAGVESGVMHACGHDTHMAAWVGAARRLVAMRDQWSGTLVMVAQPGEEIGQGAKAMLDDGLFTRFPKPTHAIAFHDSASLPAGTIGYSVGPALANVDSVDIRVRGLGGHGAYPHTTRDPIVLASRIVTTLQTLVSRELNPLDSAVVTVGSFQGGTKHNIISDEVKLLLTVRSYTPEIRQQLLDGIRRVVRGEAIAGGIPEDRMPEVTLREGDFTPATHNTDTLTQSTATLFREHFGEDRVRQVPPVMAGEDFSRYHLADPQVESLIFWVGGVPQDRWDAANGNIAELPSLHSPFWAPDPEPTIATATEAMVVAALGVFGNRP
ncbi:amidohydrolase [Sphingosinicella sp. CPCC 101087]|uniref:amidohydrolase n=1 Tax=Sphingosinicella sp. CPCC 101087 TaxID=2497754 RepID=UPI00101D1E0D|nr:amidohydrolase [Sphingosinicella sp. CPCC 101087]